jgi:hypothetical protein
VWAAGVHPDVELLIVDVDATLVLAHNDAKQGGAGPYKHSFGFHPLLAYLDRKAPADFLANRDMSRNGLGFAVSLRKEPPRLVDLEGANGAPRVASRGVEGGALIGADRDLLASTDRGQRHPERREGVEADDRASQQHQHAMSFRRSAPSRSATAASRQATALVYRRA